MAANFADYWQPLLRGARYVVLDGGLATELERRGADLRDPLWSGKVLLEKPDLIRAVHLDYLRAGAQVLTTASYQLSFPGLRDRGLTDAQAADVLRQSVALAQQARTESQRANILVAASIGCYGACRHDGSEYRGDYGLTADELIAWHRPRLDVLAHSGADLLACETIPCLDEALALAQLLREYPGTPAWISFSCRDERCVCHGETLAECVAAVGNLPNLVAVGVNCTAPHFVAGLLQSISTLADRPLLAYPNAGDVWHANEQRWKSSSCAADWTNLADSWYRAGARLIGGCCRTTPETIKLLTAQRNQGGAC